MKPTDVKGLINWKETMRDIRVMLAGIKVRMPPEAKKVVK